MIRGKKNVVDGSSINHTPRAGVEQWPLVSEWKLWYEVTTSIINLGCTSWQTTIPLFLRHVLTAEATKNMAPSATCTNQWARSVVGGRGTKPELLVHG